MIYKNETLERYKETTKGKKIAIYGSQPKYNVQEVRYADIVEVIGDIDYIIKRENLNNPSPLLIDTTFVGGKMVHVYPSIKWFQDSVDPTDVVILPALYPDLRALHLHMLKHDDYFKNVEIYYLMHLFNRPPSYHLLPPKGKIKIPKILHYCWFGDIPIPPLYEDCLATWKRFCPDYEIMFWNDKTYDFDRNTLAKISYENKQLGDTSDRVRLEVVERFGGVYMDCDVQLFKNLDKFLHNEIFFSAVNNRNICSEVPFGATPNNPLLRRVRKKHESSGIGYTAFHEITSTWDNIPSWDPRYDLMIYPPDVFAPVNDFCMMEHWTENTHAVHHRGNAWVGHRSSQDGQKGFQAGKIEAIEFMKESFGKEDFKFHYPTIYDRL